MKRIIEDCAIYKLEDIIILILKIFIQNYIILEEMIIADNYTINKLKEINIIILEEMVIIFIVYNYRVIMIL